MIGNGCIEYVDKQRKMDLKVGMYVTDSNRDYTHFELHPSMINGLCASLIPFLTIIKLQEIVINLQ